MLAAASIATLVLVFGSATVLPINMGVLALTAAFLLAAGSGLSSEEVFEFVPGDIVVLIVGITLLFGIARANGTMALFLQSALRLVGDRRWAVPWLIFLIAALMMSFGFTLAVAVLAPMAMSIAHRYQIRPLLMAMMVSHGALAASLSPVTVYAAFTKQVGEKTGIDISSGSMFLVALLTNLAFAAVLYAALGRDLRTPLAPSAAPAGSGGVTEPTSGASAPAGGSGGTTTMAIPSLDVDITTPLRLTTMRALTFIAILSLIGGAALGFEIGVVALVASTVLLLVAPRAHSEGFKDVAWGVMLLVVGMLTLMAVLQANGTVAFVADGAAAMGMPLLAVLLLLFIVGLLSAVGSSVGTIGIALPLAIPLIATGGLPAAAVVMAISTTSLIVDVSPFSTNGALVLANGVVDDRRKFQNQMLGYTGIVCVLAPIALWLALIVGR